jgi:hypothetical protein
MRARWLCLLFGCAWLAAPAVAQDGAHQAIAEQRFLRGREHYIARSYADALTEFEAVLGIAESPNALLYAARCLRELGRAEDAIVRFEQSERLAREELTRQPRYAETATAALDERAALLATVARLVVQVTPRIEGVSIRVGMRVLAGQAEGVGIVVSPGSTPVCVSADGYEPFVATVEARTGHTSIVHATLRPAEAGVVSGRVPGMASQNPDAARGPIGGAMLAAGAALALSASLPAVLAQDRWAQVSGCAATGCPTALRGIVSEGRDLDTAALGLVIAGGAVAVAGLVIVLVDL